MAGAGGGGIGTAISGMLAAAGALVVGVDNRREALDAFSAVTSAADGREHPAVVADLRDPPDVAQAIAAAGDQLHGLVHVAGGMWPPQWSGVMDMDVAIFDEVLNLNLRSMMLTTTAAARRLRELRRGGSIVALSSVAGLTAMPFGAPYAAAKSALMSLVRTEALEWGPLDIRVNAVAPGTVRTPKSTHGNPEPTAGFPGRGRRRPARPPRQLGRHRRCGALPAVRPRRLDHRPGARRRRWFLGTAVVPGQRQHPGLRPRRRAACPAHRRVRVSSALRAAVVGHPNGPAERAADGLRGLGATVTELAPAGRAELAAQLRAAGPLSLLVWAPSPGAASAAAAILDHDAATWDAHAAQPLREAVACFQAAEDVLTDGSAIVAVLPTLAMLGSAGFTAWATAAEGLRSLVKVTSREFSKRRITVNAVAVPAAALAGDSAALDRPGLPPATLPVPEDAGGDVAAVIAALAGPPWASVTGATIAVDGGVWAPA